MCEIMAIAVVKCLKCYRLIIQFMFVLFFGQKLEQNCDISSAKSHVFYIKTFMHKFFIIVFHPQCMQNKNVKINLFEA